MDEVIIYMDYQFLLFFQIKAMNHQKYCLFYTTISIMNLMMWNFFNIINKIA